MNKAQINVFNNPKFNSIDLFKLIMAICVVAIHTEPLAKCTNETVYVMYESFVDMAVPFFFLAAGFLLQNKIELAGCNSNIDQISIIKAYLIKIIKFYLIWSLVYLLLDVYHYVIVGQTNIITWALLYIRGFFFIGQHYNSWQLWYLLSTIYALLLLIMLLKVAKLNLKQMVIIGTVIGGGGYMHYVVNGLRRRAC